MVTAVNHAVKIPNKRLRSALRCPLDSTTSSGQFMLTILAALAQLECDQIVKRTADRRTARGRKDGELGGIGPPHRRLQREKRWYI